MQVSLTIIRYPKIFIPFALFAMAIHRLPLWLNKHISFYKLMGSGKNGTFDKRPDWQQWAILACYPAGIEELNVQKSLKKLYGGFVSGWLHFFNCETFTILLSPAEGHGLWDGKKVFGEFNASQRVPVSAHAQIAVLTRATIRFNKLNFFWQNVAPVAKKMGTAKGFITSFGIGEMPLLKQATFSVWRTAEDMKAFAYGMKEHADVIKMTRQQKWYSEDMFTRFSIVGSFGTVKGLDPLKPLGNT